jgi:hypothetical protein
MKLFPTALILLASALSLVSSAFNVLDTYHSWFDPISRSTIDFDTAKWELVADDFTTNFGTRTK